jgi:recombination protein RecA
MTPAKKIEKSQPKTDSLLKTAKKNASVIAAKAGPKGAKGVSPLLKARAALKQVLKEDHTVRLTEHQLSESMPHIPSGAIVIDYLIGGRPNQRGIAPCPGLPRSKIINVYGTAGAGKTTLALTAAATVCRNGGTCVYIDWENEVDPRYSEAIGVPVKDESRFLLMQPNTLEEGMKIMIQMASEGVDLIVVDSVGAGVPADLYNRKIEDEGEQGRIGLVAAKWSQFLPKFKSLIARSGTCVIGISQLRKTIAQGGHGPDSSPQGGEAWKFYSAVRMMLRVFSKEKTKTLNAMTGKMEDFVTGTKVVAKLDKCKVSDSAHHEQVFYLKSGSGIDNTRSVVDIAAAYKIVVKDGAWYEWTGAPGGGMKAQGMDGFCKKVTEREGALADLFQQVVPKLLNAKPVETDGEEEAELTEADASVDDLFADMLPSTDAEIAAKKAEAESLVEEAAGED